MEMRDLLCAIKINKWKRLFRKAHIDWKKIALHASHAQAAEPKVHPVYFSCGKHFDLLSFSIRSLSFLKLHEIGRVWCFIDPHDPLTNEQRVFLRNNISYPLEFRVTRMHMSRFGLNTVYNEMSAFVEILSEVASLDRIAKIDSDVLFLSGAIFTVALKRGHYALLGHYHFHPEYSLPYLKGGTYFIHLQVLRALLLQENYVSSLMKAVHERLEKDPDEMTEDAVITNWLRHAGGRIDHVSFESLYSHIHDENSLFKENPQKISVIHFWGDQKKHMERIFSALEKSKSKTILASSHTS